MADIFFKQDYETERTIKAHYEAASAENNTEEMEAARGEYQAFMEQVSGRGEHYAKLYRLYSEAMGCGNKYIDFHDAIWDRQVEGLIASLRENGIEHFTFSSTWSSAVETAWLFAENGCTLEGLLQINSPHKAFGSEEYEKVPAYLFAVH